MENRRITAQGKVFFAMLALAVCLLAGQAAVISEETRTFTDADLGELVRQIGTHQAEGTEHEFALNHLLGSTYQRGDAGAEITIIKDRMKEIGYYTPAATYNNQFNGIMEERIKDFQESSGLYPNGVIDGKTLKNLYAADPVRGPYDQIPYDEPELTMIIPQGSRLRSVSRQRDVVSVGIEVKNISHQKKIASYYLCIYTVDSKGNKLQEVIFDTIDLVPCGGKGYSDYVDLNHHSRIDKVYAGIKKVYYKDGSRTETIENPVYHCWSL